MTLYWILFPRSRHKPPVFSAVVLAVLTEEKLYPIPVSTRHKPHFKTLNSWPLSREMSNKHLGSAKVSQGERPTYSPLGPFCRIVRIAQSRGPCKVERQTKRVKRMIDDVVGGLYWYKKRTNCIVWPLYYCLLHIYSVDECPRVHRAERCKHVPHPHPHLSFNISSETEPHSFPWKRNISRDPQYIIPCSATLCCPPLATGAAPSHTSIFRRGIMNIPFLRCQEFSRTTGLG